MNKKSLCELWGLTSAFRILSILPCWGENSNKYGQILVWSPVVSLVISLAAVVPGWLLLQGGQPRTEIAAAFTSLLAGTSYTAIAAFLSRGFHLDGLADSFDGWGGGWTKENTLRIMKDSHIGSFGTIALILAISVKICGAAVLFYFQAWPQLILISPAAGLFMVMQAAFNKYARENESLAGNVVSETRPVHALVSALVFIAIAAAVCCVYCSGGGLLNGKEAAVMLLSGSCLTWLIGFISRRRLDGVTGDILGASKELNEAWLFWLGAALCCLR
ncbi:MAG: adenosylcobinamide-GDP ribazoletransferase [Candidatus Bruticola sp.]